MPEISRRSVLTVLGAGAVAAGAAASVHAAAGAGPAPAGRAAGPDNPVRAENRLPGSADWRIGAGDTVGSDDLGRQIAGYASATSVNLGDSIDFHVSTEPAQRFTVAIYRLGYYGGAGARQLTASPTLSGVKQPEPVTDPANGMIHCPWSASWTLHVPGNWTSGAYLAAFTTEDGHRSVTPFVVRDDARRSDFLVVLPFTTYQAYNQWPLDGTTGKSLYYGYGNKSNAGEDQTDGGDVRVDVHGKPVSYGARAKTVSFARPYSGVGLPQRIDLDYEFLQWAERMGYDLSYATSIDLHQGVVTASQHSALVFSGHDEYWSQDMRETVSAAVDRGTHLAYIAANNVYWHVRFEQDPYGRETPIMACWKSDPDPAADKSGPTCLWREVKTNGETAEQSLLGVMYNGIPREEVPLSVSNPQHWFWDGTGVHDGTTIPGIVGGEADGYYPGSPAPRNLVSHTLLSASHYMALGGSNWPRVQHTSLYETNSGAVVFAAATFNWSFGLNRAGYVDARIQRATANLFARISKRA
ncbi:hypothetical protein KDK95_18170 [Actinospica sp. MGRD01-02]|uniref:N,N-dimethylformamidase beta subunit-like C-terminal domain-containing protein n=1 Tax=Actinospica acidithermotolerans TaxID=2828514 RepID=A0A941EB36_9ACTN|nr:N,N-dimethylformamidase beta subunit family domain-containing protein [Actinospica acidithermotolerans]MBR7828246.1 hypothetical protein [Actinospica acidithermotolerans]